jgi:fermentation-respiration switch protein FrsA (DUF1100 family)
MRHTIYIVLLVGLTACGKQRLDPFMFVNDNSISEYLLDDYAGDTEITLPATYSVTAANTYLFSLVNSSELAPRVYMVYLGDTSAISTDTVILYCHGNTDHMDRYWPRAKLLAHAGGEHRYGVLMLDYPGYGLSEGDPSEEGVYESVDLAMRWLKGRGLTDDRLIMYGYSLGTGPACELTAHVRSMQPSQLLIENPFASTHVLVQDASGIALPPSYVTSANYDNANDITSVTEPFLWMHGIDDDFLRIETHGEVVYSNYSGCRGEAHRIPGAGHSNLPEVMGYEAYLEMVSSFILAQ